MAMDIDFHISKGFKRLRENWHKRYLIAYGGSSSSKSISILQSLTLYALRNKNKRITISAESLPVLKKTVIPDWREVVMQGMYSHGAFNKTDMVYTFPTGSIFQFIPADDPARWHGLRQDIVYFDELFHIKQAIYNQADIRTKDKVISSFNPVAEFWITDHFKDTNTYVDHSTYKDNPYISQPIIDALEKRISTDKNFYDVYVLGKFGSLEGLIFKEGVNWNVTTDWPEQPKKRNMGLDFGFSIDPAAIIEVAYSNGELWLREKLYRTGMTNADLQPYLSGRVIADSAEPKSIEELRRLGVDIRPSVKGRDSINAGIQLMKQFKINVTQESTNLIKELRNYSWAENRQGERLTKPIDAFNHGIDAGRYAVQSMFNERNIFFI
jgi:phage terminase large subunit